MRKKNGIVLYESFRLYIGKEFYHVVIFDKKADMVETFQIANGYPTNGDSLAITQRYRIIRFKGKKEHVSRRIGRIWFSRENLTGGIIAHEMTHAVIMWAQANGRIKELARAPKRDKKAKQFLATDSIDELIPHYVGEFCRKFYNKLFELKIWK